MKKTVQVTMLPAKELIQASVDDNKYLKQLVLVGSKFPTLYYSTFFDGMIAENAQHLYFTSNEEIKEGDRVLRIHKSVGLKDIFQSTCDNPEAHYKYHNQKIIATTDKSLGLPLIPQSFVEEYVRKNGEIKEVEVTGWYPELENGVAQKYMHIPLTDPINNQQTVEEAAEELYPTYHEWLTNPEKEAFIAGAKWQQDNPNS